MNFRDIIHKYRVPVILAAVVLIFTAAACYLIAQEEDHGRNPIDGINENRSYIPVTGQDYSLNYEQENAYLEEEQRRAEAIEEKIQQQTDRTDSQDNSEPQDENNLSEDQGGNHSGGQGSGSADEGGGNGTGGGSGAGEGEDGENIGGDQDISRLPVIICSLTDGQTIDGAFLSFTVRATSYKNVQLGAFDISVTVNGSKIYSSGNQDGTVSYRT